MRVWSFILATCVVPAYVTSAAAALPSLVRLPNAIAVATPGTGSAPILSAGIAGAAALVAMTRRRTMKRTRGLRLGATGTF